MKKFFAIILTLCLMACALCITAFAAEAGEGVVLRVSAEKKDGSIVVIEDYKVFEDGWNAAMELAVNSKEMNKNDYARVVVDIYADWNAVNGEFTKEFFNGKGFNWDAIYIQPNVRMTLNLNGNTINRGLTEWEYNGEVMYIDKRADVIINEGTITGGFSCNGAGGIHINDGANVVLNNVNIVGNSTDDDDGAGIAVYGGATLTMNNGTIVGNKAYGSSLGGGIYVHRANATLDGVLIHDNELITTAVEGLGNWATGAGCCVSQGALTLNNCTVKDNRSARYGGGLALMYEGDLVVNHCTVTGNSAGLEGSAIAIIEEGDCVVDGSDVTGNESASSNSVFYVQWGTLQFSNSQYDPQITCWADGEVIYADGAKARLTNSRFGSIFGEGSLTMIISLIALIASIAAIIVNVTPKKDTAAAAAAVDSGEDDE